MMVGGPIPTDVNCVDKCPRCGHATCFWTTKQHTVAFRCTDLNPCAYRKEPGKDHLENHDMIVLGVERLQRTISELERALHESGGPEPPPWEHRIIQPTNPAWVQVDAEKILTEASERLYGFSGYLNAPLAKRRRQQPLRQRTRDVSTETSAEGGGKQDQRPPAQVLNVAG